MIACRLPPGQPVFPLGGVGRELGPQVGVHPLGLLGHEGVDGAEHAHVLLHGPGDAVSLEVITSSAGEAGDSVISLEGGDVLARRDFPQLLSALSSLERPIQCSTAGHLLRSPAVLDLLRSFPQVSVRTTLFSSEPGCHDWVAQRPGEAKTILRGLRSANLAGIEQAVEVPVVRPAVSTLTATVRDLHTLGVRAISFRLVRLEYTPPDRRVALGARVSLLTTPLAEACARALSAGMSLRLLDFPRCTLPANLQPYQVDQNNTGVPCPRCGSPCVGLPEAYVSMFGDLELRTSPEGEAESFEMSWSADEPRREIRRRLLLALEHRPFVLRLVGADILRHGAAPELLREAVRSATRVELTADLSPLVQWSPDQLHRVRKLARAESMASGPETDRALELLAASGVSA